MKTTAFAALLFASTLAAGSAVAQPAPYNEVGVTMGHWHLISKDVEANKKIFLGMGAKMFMIGGNPFMMFPGTYINLTLGTEKGDGGSRGSVVNHVGFIVNNVQEQVAKWKAAGVAVLPGGNNRLDQAYVETPDGLRIEILEDKAQLPTKGRVLDHIGFDVKDLQAFIKKIEAEGIKLDEPYRKNEATGSAITYVTDPWGTRVELVQRGPMP